MKNSRKFCLKISRRSITVILLVGLISAFLLFWQTPGFADLFSNSKKGLQGILQPTEQPAAELSPAEQDYLDQTGAIRLCVDPDWWPYERINEDGMHEGIAADLVQLIAERSGVVLELYPTRDWSESIRASKTGQCHLLSFLNQTPERDAWLIFTDTYFSDPNVLITREEHKPITDPASLTGETVVLPEGTSVEERLRRDYPNLTFLTVETEAEALNMVSARQADMTVRSLTMAAFVIKEEGLFNLKIAGEIPNYNNQFRIGVVQDQPMLRDILNHGVRKLTQQDVEQIVNRHIVITVETPVNYDLIVKISIGFALVILVGFLWNYQLRSLNQKLAQQKGELTTLSEMLQADIAERIRTEDILRKSEEKYRILVDSANEVIVVIQDGVLRLVNAVTMELTGFSEEELTLQPFYHFVHPEDRSTVMERYRARMSGEETANRYEFRVLAKKGGFFWVQNNSVVIEWEGRPATLNFLTNITERKQMEAELRKSEEKFRFMAENSSDIIWHLDKDYRFTYISPADERMRGFTNSEVIGTTIWEQLKPEGLEYVRRSNRQRLASEKQGVRTGAIRYELELGCKDGSWIWTEISVSAHHNQNGELIGYHGVTRDISAQKKLQEELQQQATTDSLTGVFNRRHFMQLASREIKRAFRHHHSLAIAMIDIDHFKDINDTHGHAAGDQALTAFTQICLKNIREIDVFARLGGDEFALLLPETDREQAYIVVERIRSVLAAQPVALNESPIFLSISAGITCLGKEKEDLDTLLSRADRALYDAKENGRNRVAVEHPHQ